VVGLLSQNVGAAESVTVLIARHRCRVEDIATVRVSCILEESFSSQDSSSLFNQTICFDQVAPEQIERPGA
jgi:hypothetical protein